MTYLGSSNGWTVTDEPERGAMSAEQAKAALFLVGLAYVVVEALIIILGGLRF